MLNKSRKTSNGMEEAKPWLDNFNQQAKK